MSEDLVIPWDLLENEVPRHLPFYPCRALGLTCRRLQGRWKLWIRELPPSVAMWCQDEHLFSFPSLKTLNTITLSNNLVEVKWLSTLTNLTSLKLGRNLRVLEAEMDEASAIKSIDTSSTIGYDIWQEIMCNSDSYHEYDDVFPFWINMTLQSLTRLVTLDIRYLDSVVDPCLALLTSLTSLNLGINALVTDVGISRLTNLTSLTLGDSTKITYAGLAPLTKLRYLDMGETSEIQPADLPKLTNLISLKLDSGDQYDDESISSLTNLTSLDLQCTNLIGDRGLRNLIKLRFLDLGNNDCISDACLGSLTNLTELHLGQSCIHNAGIASLTNLRILHLDYDRMITAKGLGPLTNLTELHLGNAWYIDDDGFKRLTSVKTLYLNNRNTSPEHKPLNLDVLRARGIDIK